MKKTIFSISLLLFLTSCVFDDNHKKHAADALQSVVDSYYGAAAVKSGISVALYKDGYIWSYATGSAAAGTAMTTSTPSYAYSITKTITSALVLNQVEDGLYTLDNTVEEILSDDASYISLSSGQKALINTNATVRQLLNHTSGMPDYAVTNIYGILGLCDPAVNWSPVYILQHVVNTGYSNVGTFSYSNTNYILLGMIAEHAGGDTMNRLLAAEFFTPLGIEAALAPQDSIPSNISRPYDDAKLFSSNLPENSFYYISDILPLINPSYDFFTGAGRATWAAGGIISTAENLAKWGYKLYDTDGTAVSSTVRGWIKNSATTDGAYGYGVDYNLFTYRDGTQAYTYGHSGSAVGYKTLLEYESTERICVVIMTNANNLYDNAFNPSWSDAELGIVDRIALAEALLKTYQERN